jgi:hypothetical protein
VVLEQVTNGLAVRMALLFLMLGGAATVDAPTILSEAAHG